MIEYQLTIFMCSHCTKVYNQALLCLKHEKCNHSEPTENDDRMLNNDIDMGENDNLIASPTKSDAVENEEDSNDATDLVESEDDRNDMPQLTRLASTTPPPETYNNAADAEPLSRVEVLQTPTSNRTRTHGNGTHACTICSRTFSSRSNVRQHLRNVHKVADKLHSDKIDRLTTPPPCAIEMDNDRLSDAPNEVLDFPESESSKTIATMAKEQVPTADLEQAAILPVDTTDGRRFQCPKCSQTFSQMPSARRHLQKLHTKVIRPRSTKTPAPTIRNEIRFQCEECDFCTNNQLSFTNHVARYHGELVGKRTTITTTNGDGEERYNCDKCSFNTKWQSNILKHRRMLHGGRTKERTEVEKDGSVKSEDGNEEAHDDDADDWSDDNREMSAVVNGEKPPRIACHLCPKTFAFLQGRRRHLRTIHGTKPIAETTSKQSNPVNLRGEKMYATARKFTCVPCKKSFTLAKFLQLHRRSGAHRTMVERMNAFKV